MSFASPRPRQQHRPSAPRIEEENAARRRVPGDETASVLRKAVGTNDARARRSHPARAQTGAQAGATRRPHSRSEEETLGCESAGTAIGDARSDGSPAAALALLTPALLALAIALELAHGQAACRPPSIGTCPMCWQRPCLATPSFTSFIEGSRVSLRDTMRRHGFGGGLALGDRHDEA